MALERVGDQSVGPTSQGSVSAIQAAQNVEVTNSTLTVVGGDSHTHYHYGHRHCQSSNKDLQTLLDAIPNFRKIQQETLARATSGTIIWLFECEQFRMFIDVDGILKILWGSGMPGAGKTILASIVIARLEAMARASNGDICVGYIYIRYSDQDRVTIRDILETLVKQSVERHPDCMLLCEEAYHQHLRERTRPTEDELVKLLCLFSSKRKVTFYVLDALDEAPKILRRKLVQTLSTLGARLFITSRPLPELEAKFPAAGTFPIHAQDQDLDLHIEAKISESQELEDLLDCSGPAFKEWMISMVKVNCGGMFLHATLQLNALQGCTSVHDAVQTLQAFPRDIEDMYQRTWSRIVHSESSTHQKSLAIAAFAWILYAKQSLTVEELCHTLATCPETYHYDPARVVPETTVFSACRGLLVADRESRLVRLVHYTAKIPLESLLLEYVPSPHSLLTAVCITRLADCGFQNSRIECDSTLDHVLQADPLLDYAYGAWAFHASQSIDVDQITWKRVSAFISGCRAFPARIRSGHKFYHFEVLTSLHVAALYNLPILTAGSRAIEKPNILTPVGSHTTPLHLACYEGHQAAARTLLSLPNIYVNQGDNYNMTPLMIACEEGHEAIVAALLSCPDVWVNAESQSVWLTALICASKAGHAGVVQRLLAHPDIDVNARDRYSTALLYAIGHRHPSVAQLLLAADGIDVHTPSKYGDTAIRLAAEHGYEDIVRRLLEFPNIKIGGETRYNETRVSALSAAQANGHIKIVKLLQNFEAKTVFSTHVE